MADNIHFSVNDVHHFRDGAKNALDDICTIDREADAKARHTLFEAERIIKHVDGVLNVMEEDKKTASAVRSHNKEVLARMENHLYELERKLAQLEETCNRARTDLVNASSYESRVSTMAISPDASSEERASRQKLIESAHRATEAARQRVRMLENEIRKLKEAIRLLKENIEQTKKLIELLYQIIKKLEESISQTATYRRRLIDDKHQLEWELPKYSNVRHNSTMALQHCDDCANRASEYGRKLYRLLDPDGSVSSDNCYISFSDRTALGTLSTELSRICNAYEDSEYDMRKQAKAHGETMQDAVMTRTTQIVGDVLRSCSHPVRQLQHTARDCKAADRELRAYYDLCEKTY